MIKISKYNEDKICPRRLSTFGRWPIFAEIGKSRRFWYFLGSVRLFFVIISHFWPLNAMKLYWERIKSCEREHEDADCWCEPSIYRVLDNGNAIFIHTCACNEQPPTDVIINAIVEAGFDVEESRESGNELLSN